MTYQSGERPPARATAAANETVHVSFWSDRTGGVWLGSARIPVAPARRLTPQVAALLFASGGLFGMLCLGLTLWALG